MTGIRIAVTCNIINTVRIWYIRPLCVLPLYGIRACLAASIRLSNIHVHVISFTNLNFIVIYCKLLSALEVIKLLLLLVVVL